MKIFKYAASLSFTNLIFLQGQNSLEQPTLEQLLNSRKVKISFECYRDENNVDMQQWQKIVVAVDDLITKCYTYPDERDEELFEEVYKTMRFIRNERKTNPCPSIKGLLYVGGESIAAEDNKVENNIILETERLQIRYLTSNDAAALIRILSDKDVMHYSVTGPLTFPEIERYLQNKLLKSYQENGWGRYALIKKDDQTLIGYCGLGIQSIGDGKQYIDLGYKIAKDHWGKGYATEAAKALVIYARDVLKISELIAITSADHKASINVIEKSGFQFWKTGFFHEQPAQIYRIILNPEQ